jgi:deazaflavin-dependent oxidoreductase (nitroreductase family)
MPLPRFVARFNKRVTNRFLQPLAGRFENFGVVLHVGRKSGRSYRTPVNYFTADDPGLLVIALTYGPKTDWVQNVLAGGGDIETTRGLRRISSAKIVGRQAVRTYLPLTVRLALRVLRVHDFTQPDTTTDTSL